MATGAETVHSDHAERVRASGLWNRNHVIEAYDPVFLDMMERLIDQMERTGHERFALVELRGPLLRLRDVDHSARPFDFRRAAASRMNFIAASFSGSRSVGIDQRLNGQVPGDLVFRDAAGKRVVIGDTFGQRPVVLVLVYYECPMLYADPQRARIC